jgi:hypothetical protein
MRPRIAWMPARSCASSRPEAQSLDHTVPFFWGYNLLYQLNIEPSGQGDTCILGRSCRQAASEFPIGGKAHEQVESNRDLHEPV